MYNNPIEPCIECPPDTASAEGAEGVALCSGCSAPLRTRRQTAVSRAQSEILADVTAGVVPVTCGSFAELHNYVDANEYGGACESFSGSEEHCEFWNAVHDDLNEWIEEGGLREATGAMAS